MTRKRSDIWKSISFLASVVNFIIPCVVFSLTAALMTFYIHWNAPVFCWVLVGTIFGIVCVLGYFALREDHRKTYRDDHTWYKFSFVTSLFGWISAIFFGYINFELNIKYFHQYGYMGLYVDVDVQTDSSLMYLDGGLFLFTDARLDISKSSSYKKGDTYCVAPIISGNGTMSSYDYWAIGTDCCTGYGTGYSCGQYDNIDASGGLRLIDDAAAEAYYTFAVSEAASMWDVTVGSQPIFVYWLEDPYTTMENYWERGFSNYSCFIFVFVTLQLFLVTSAAIYYWRTVKH